MPSSRPLLVVAPTTDRSSVDTADTASLSFAPPNPSPRAPASRVPARKAPRAPIAVGPGRPALAATKVAPGGLLGVMPEYPIQTSKVQAPPLRDETLARDRLLEWLAVKIHDRVVLVTAEAGYGKTTLLADFSRRTRLRALWFRLDRGDRDWVGFIAHLTAAVRVHLAEFGAATSALLRETATSAPPLDAVLDTFLRELGDLPPDPTVLILDDFHLVDDAPDIRRLVKELLARAPERLSFVFASRRTPPLRLARLRSLGEVAELGTDDLRFDAAETERLFTETYEMRIEPGLIVELSRRTEGWAASLQLVRTALHDRDPVQVGAFIRSLSGAEGHLYDYLAEEVVGDLPRELQQFLMRTSLLETIDLDLGPVAADVPAATTRHLIDDGERLGLFGRRGAHTRYQVRAHPLVRDFLQARLARSIGAAGVAAVHRRIAIAAERLDWSIAAHHFLAAGDEADARRVLVDSLDVILATGAYAAAGALTDRLYGSELPGSAGLVVASRLALQRADPVAGLQLAERAWAADQQSTPALLNLLTARTFAGDLPGALALGRILERSEQSMPASIARAYQRVIETSLDGNLVEATSELVSMAATLRGRSDDHFLGVAMLNQALVRTAMGDLAVARECAAEAVTLLRASSAGIELVSARHAYAWTLAYMGDLGAARQEFQLASREAPAGQALEAGIEEGGVETLLGDSDRAWRVLEPVNDQITAKTDTGEQALLIRALLLIREGDLDGGSRDVEALHHWEPRTSIAFEARRQAARGLLDLLSDNASAKVTTQEARALAEAQGAGMWARYASVIEAVASGTGDPSARLAAVYRVDPSALSMAAEAVVHRLDSLDEPALEEISLESIRRPERWRGTLRRALDQGSSGRATVAARLLSRIGEPIDVKRLRTLGRALRDPMLVTLSRDLARALAPRVMVEDLGRLRILVGDRVVEGSEVRRKVLALLCLLLSKSRFSTTREEVLEALWPELDPASALNSLNQTVYFLRRVFELEYREDTSPGYVRQDGETIWLDPELVDSRSHRCRALIRSLPASPSPDQVEHLADEYRARFALDFAYEEWASAYRDSLHAGYLRVVEQAIRLDIDTGHFSRGMALAERAAEVEPESEEIQLHLVHLYRLAGAHAAAAEQYGHYAQALRDLGVDPPSFSEV